MVDTALRVEYLSRSRGGRAVPHSGLELRQAASRRADSRARRAHGQAPALERRHDRRPARAGWNGTLMAGRPTRTPRRGSIRARAGRCPEGIRWRADRQRYQIRVVGPSVDGGAAERSRTFLTLAEAKRELAKMVAGRNPNGSMTLEQWHEKYWPAIESSIRPATGAQLRRGLAAPREAEPGPAPARRHHLADDRVGDGRVVGRGIRQERRARGALAPARRRASLAVHRLQPGARGQAAEHARVDLAGLAGAHARPDPDAARPRSRRRLPPLPRRARLHRHAGGGGDRAARRRRRLRARHHPRQPVAESGPARRADRAVAEESQVPRRPADRRAASLRRGGRARQAGERPAVRRRRRRAAHEPQRAPRRSTGRRFARRSADPTCASTTSGTRSRRSCSMPAPPRPTCRRRSATRACRSPSATRAPARASRSVPAQP